MTMKIKNIPFIGGDTATFEFDFGTKVFGSVAECPMQLYTCTMSTLQSPANKTNDFKTGWAELTGNYGSQADFDKIKTQDNIFDDLYYLNNGSIMQIMVELDLNPLCTALFGGSTNAMAAACKNIITDVYAKGSGSNNGVQANGVITKRWYSSSGIWDGVASGENDTSSISDIHEEDSRTDQTKIGFFPNNKFYLIVYAKYASNGTIPSEVDIDYINIKLQFARVPDVISQIPITLPDTWSMLIKGFSPAWDNTALGKLAIQMYSFDSSGAYEIQYSNQKFNFIKWIGSTGYLCSRVSLPFDKFKIFNFLIEQTATGKRMRVLQNGSTVEKYTDNDVNKLPSNSYLSFNNHFNDMRTDAFYNSIVFLPNRNFDDDAEAEAILRGTAEGFEEDELIDVSKIPWNEHVTVDNSNKIVIVSNAPQYWGTGTDIHVLPNNQYILTCTISGAGYVNVYEYFSNGSYIVKQYLSISVPFIFTTTARTIRVGINFGVFQSNGSATFTNPSLKLKM